MTPHKRNELTNVAIGFPVVLTFCGALLLATKYNLWGWILAGVCLAALIVVAGFILYGVSFVIGEFVREQWRGWRNR